MKNYMYKFKSSWSDVEVDTRKATKEFRMSHWAEVIKDRNASDMNTKAYCESIGIHENVFYYWQRKLREAAYNELDLAVQNQLPVSPPQGWAICTSEQQKTGDFSSSISVEIGKFKVAVSDGDDLELFTKVCQSLMSLC